MMVVVDDMASMRRVINAGARLDGSGLRASGALVLVVDDMASRIRLINVPGMGAESEREPRPAQRRPGSQRA